MISTTTVYLFVCLCVYVCVCCGYILQTNSFVWRHIRRASVRFDEFMNIIVGNLRSSSLSAASASVKYDPHNVGSDLTRRTIHVYS